MVQEQKEQTTKKKKEVLLQRTEKVEQNTKTTGKGTHKILLS